jgi:hypothetical protein
MTRTVALPPTLLLFAAPTLSLLQLTLASLSGFLLAALVLVLLAKPLSLVLVIVRHGVWQHIGAKERPASRSVGSECPRTQTRCRG